MFSSIDSFMQVTFFIYICSYIFISSDAYEINITPSSYIVIEFRLSTIIFKTPARLDIFNSMTQHSIFGYTSPLNGSTDANFINRVSK